MRFLLLLSIFIVVLVAPVNAQDEDTVSLPGRIAYVGLDHNVYVLTPQTNAVAQLSDDATDDLRYQWPTWSTDGRLAYFQSSFVNDFVSFMRGVYVSPDAQSESELVYRSGNDVFQYAYWSPSNCDASGTCRDLAVLLSSPEQGMFLELIRDGVTMEQNQTLLGGPPFYYSWSPDGQRMLWHRVEDERVRLEIYDVTDNTVLETLPQQPGFINAPGWSPVDDRLLIGVRNTDNAGVTDLVISGHNEVTTLATELDGLVSFAWSPDGNRVAYRVADNNAYGPLVVVDATTTETVTISPSEEVIAFFWSPDSQRIAYVTFANNPGAFNISNTQQQRDARLVWSVLDVSTGTTYTYGAFVPTGDMVYMLRFFDQFAQSHRIWSPDSRHIIYSELAPGGPVISLVDGTEIDSVPFSIAEGLIGIWSFD